MAFPTKDYRQIRADILRDIANQQPAAYIGEDSDFAVRANAVASSIEGLYEHQKWIVRQVFPDTADSDYLERHASLRGITRKAAAFATGTVRFSGTVGSAVPIGTEVLAAEQGTVAYAGSELKGYGNLILLRHEEGWVTAYAHNEEILVKRGDKVKRGQSIAKAGKTGTVDQPQVHFEVRQGQKPVDPLPHMEKL